MPRQIFLSLMALSLGLSSLPAFAQSSRMPDLRKAIIEVPLKRTINPTFDHPTAQKLAPVEAPLIEERVISVTDKGVAKVKPGAVTWHKNFDDARTAAASSGKPVLMFAMMGSLDDKFC
jgi:hypothetical protein